MTLDFKRSFQIKNFINILLEHFKELRHIVYKTRGMEKNISLLKKKPYSKFTAKELIKRRLFEWFYYFKDFDIDTMNMDFIEIVKSLNFKLIEYVIINSSNIELKVSSCGKEYCLGCGGSKKRTIGVLCYYNIPEYIIKLAIDKGADITDSYNLDGKSCFKMICSKKYVYSDDLVKYFIDNDCILITSLYSESPLIDICKTRSYNLIMYALDKVDKITIEFDFYKTIKVSINNREFSNTVKSKINIILKSKKYMGGYDYEIDDNNIDKVMISESEDE